MEAMARIVAARLMPNECFVCGQGARSALVCGACRENLPRLATVCPVCALPSGEDLICGSCQRAEPAFDATAAALPYVFPVDRLVQALKYGRRLALARFLSGLLEPLVPPQGPAVVVPMPLHPGRLRERGFNQAAEIARPLARAWGLPFETAAVERVRDTAPQASLPWLERRRNMRGAFRCHGSFDGRTVVVVDDVMTTGATLDELARTLKSHGAARVVNRVVARTPSPV
ncbi:DNA utilization protein GntX [Azoarcus sp. Aa7]|nr:DNA utilization protein GntX [Azoarcus sp. Aa7]